MKEPVLRLVEQRRGPSFTTRRYAIAPYVQQAISDAIKRGRDDRAAREPNLRRWLLSWLRVPWVRGRW